MKEDLFGIAVLASAVGHGLERRRTAKLVLEVHKRHPEIEALLLQAKRHGLQRSLADRTRALTIWDNVITQNERPSASTKTQDESARIIKSWAGKEAKNHPHFYVLVPAQRH